MFSRGEGPKIDKGYLLWMNMEKMNLFTEVKDIGSKSMLQRL